MVPPVATKATYVVRVYASAPNLESRLKDANVVFRNAAMDTRVPLKKTQAEVNALSVRSMNKNYRDLH